MKRVFCLILCILCLYGLCACARGEEGVPEGKLRARSAELDLYVFYPNTWTVEQNDSCLKLVSAEEKALLTEGAALSANRPPLANVTIMRLHADPVPDSIAAYAAQGYRQAFGEAYRFEGDPEIGVTGGVESYTFTYRKLSGEEVEYCFRQCVLLHGGSLWALTYTATPSLFESFLEDAKALMQSLTFEASESDDVPSRAQNSDTETPPEGYRIATNDGVHFKLCYPERGWEVVQDTGIITLRAHDRATVSVSTFWSGADINSLEQYADERYYPDFDALYGAHTELSRSADSPDGVARLTLSYTAVIEGENFTFLQAMYARAGYIYTVLYTAKSAAFETHLSEVEDMLTRFKFK